MRIGFKGDFGSMMEALARGWGDKDSK